MNLFKQTGQSIRDQAKKAAQQMQKEPSEMFEAVKHQVAPQTSESQAENQQPSVIDQIITQNGKFKAPTSIEQAQIHSFAKKRLQEIEAELRQLRMQREQKSQEWAKEQQNLMQDPDTGQKKQEVALPSSGRKHGSPRPGQQKGGTMEVARNKKG